MMVATTTSPTVAEFAAFLAKHKLDAHFDGFAAPGAAVGIACLSAEEPDVPQIVAGLEGLGATFPRGRAVVFNSDHFGHVHGVLPGGLPIRVMVRESVTGYQRELRF